MDLYQLDDRVALITGAGSGLGRAAALRLARAGARIGALGRTPTQLDETVAAISQAGGEGISLTADVSEPDQVSAAVERLLEKWGRLDIVFANAGINGVWAPVWELEPAEWDQTLDINLKGTFLTIRYAVPHMMERGGAIVITSSVNGTRTFFNSGNSPYAASKAGQVAFAKTIALELAQFKIRVNVICPGWIKSEIGDNTWPRHLEKVRDVYGPTPTFVVPLTGNRPGSPEQVAELVLFLVSDASSHITGTEVWIDGGGSLY